MKNYHLVLFVLIVTMTVVSSCNRPSVIGGELLEDDRVDIVFTDTVSIIAKTIESDSIRVFEIDNQLEAYLCGELDDPVFGGVRATNYIQTRLSVQNPGFRLSDRVDSLILAIPYDTTALYGNFQEEHTIKVYRLTEDLSNLETYFSNDAFEFDPDPIASFTFTPDPFTETTAINYNTPGVATIDSMLPPMVRIPIDESFAEEILRADSTVLSNDTSFLAAFKGFFIEVEGASKESMLSFQYRNAFSSLQMYYVQDDTLNRQFNFLTSNASVKTVNFDHFGASTSIAADFLDDTEKGDSLLFFQGMQGTNVNFQFPHIEELSDFIINKATLELTVATLDGDDIDLFEPVEQVLLSERTADGELLLIEDITLAFNVGTLAVFGGDLEIDEDLNLRTYSINMSAVLQDMVLGQVPNEIVLTLFLTNQRANRSVVFGPNHSMFPAKLNVTYTNN